MTTQLKRVDWGTEDGPVRRILTWSLQERGEALDVANAQLKALRKELEAAKAAQAGAESQLAHERARRGATIQVTGIPTAGVAAP